MTEQEAQVLRDTATSAEQNALLNSQKLVKMQAEIDELRAALLESEDVGLRLLTCRSLFSLARGEINAQRNVLEQALEALESWSRLAPDLALPEYADAITAIQGALHGHS